MSSNLPEFPLESSQWDTRTAYFDLPSREPGPTTREWVISAALLCITFISTSFAGLFQLAGFDVSFALHAFAVKPGLIFRGLLFSVPLISILLAHELGHFIACRYYGMRCTPPFFIPIPFTLIGTFGAFIKIKSRFRHNRALFDIGVAGPLAGFLFTLPTLWIGISLSRLIPKGSFAPGELVFGEPLILRFFAALILGYSPDRQDLIVHPMAMAAWVGLLATSLNLLPIWQLDGGHILYAVAGQSWQKKITIVSISGLMLLSFLRWPPALSYLLFGVLLLVIGVRVRFYHPPTLMDQDELGPGRIFVGLLALLILILSFTLIPISIT